jgi:hypothetical protein
MSYSNGRMPRSALAPITVCANGDRGYLRKDAAAAFNAMNAESQKRYGVTLRAASGRTTYRNLAAQRYFWNLYLSGRGSLAARPGTSNHGLGTTVDLASTQMRAIVDKIGAKYGFAKRWSDAPSEWWHIKWDASHVSVHIPPPFRTLRRGHQGKRVRWVQMRLRDKGFRSVKASGYFGETTVAAVKKVQRAHKLKPDGVVGPRTWAVLGRG